MNYTFLVWLATATLLFFKMLSNSILQGKERKKAGTFPWPENTSYFGGTTREDSPRAQRASAIWRNDLENIPMFLIFSLAFVMLDGSTGFMIAYGLIFVLSRSLHSLFFMTAKQPHRFIAYACGGVTTLLVVIHSWILAFS